MKGYFDTPSQLGTTCRLFVRASPEYGGGCCSWCVNHLGAAYAANCGCSTLHPYRGLGCFLLTHPRNSALRAALVIISTPLLHHGPSALRTALRRKAHNESMQKVVLYFDTPSQLGTTCRLSQPSHDSTPPLLHHGRRALSAVACYAPTKN